jgi:hypothetical protein
MSRMRPHSWSPGRVGGDSPGIGGVEVLAVKMRDVCLSLLGGTMVYVAMAACSAGGDAGSVGSVGGVGSGGATVRAGNGGGGSVLDSGLIDALMDPVPRASADPTDGSRLKAQYLLADDGSKAYVPDVWFDSQRNETCAFTVAADGKQRCLPAGGAVTMYSDSMCTTPVLALPSGCTTPPYAVGTDLSTCTQAPDANHVYTVGAAVSPAPAALYMTTGTACFSVGSPTGSYGYFAIGAEVPASSFVAASTLHD